ncbi:hypothetical protein [Mycobacterium sp.]|jgi:hypothetical protein|uniref:hypothetical protein n=1 Tax=Mycobacterium sp. TaxID=1785 RepID=UPI002D2D4088|nr:hypothetical protein [Mycobacterium sp.]HZA08567.1 hypothetical protein [Mycobacterium sp.]
MIRPRPGWLVTLFAAVIVLSGWLPWLATTANGGGHASAIGGTFGSIVIPARFGAGQLIVLLASTLAVAGAMTARGLSPRLSALAALVVSLLIGLLTVSYYRLNVHPPVAAAYGLYIGAAGAVGAVVCSVWAVASAYTAPRVVARAAR